MADLEALSREIAATSDAWMVPGVDVISATGQFRLDNSDFVDGRLFSWVAPHGSFHPNLTDAVTVNSLLGAGSVWQSLICNEFTARIADAATFSPDRTEAICRAWIAAHKGEK